MRTSQIDILAPCATDAPHPNIGAKLTTTHAHPILYRQITKCGCTYVHNVLQTLDNVPADPNTRVSAAHYSNNLVLDTPARFIVIRNPISRFTSLYFDKAMGADHAIKHRLIRNKIIDPDVGGNLEAHQENCYRFLYYIKQTLDGAPDRRPDWHWRPQLVRLTHIAPFDFHVITLEGLSWQLPVIATDTVPQISQALQDVPLRNVSTKLIDASKLMVPELTDILRDIYSTDFEIHNQVSRYWDTYQKGHLTDGKT